MIFFNKEMDDIFISKKHVKTLLLMKILIAKIMIINGHDHDIIRNTYN